MLRKFSFILALNVIFNLGLFHQSNAESISLCEKYINENDFDKSIYECKKEIVKNNPSLQEQIPNDKNSTVPDYQKAFQWYMSAAEQGDITSQIMIGKMYYLGKGVTKNSEEAFKWIKKAAEQGNIDAQFNLAAMYKNGEGTAPNEEEALKWLKKVSEQGGKRAEELLTNVKIMSLPQIIRNGGSIEIQALISKGFDINSKIKQNNGTILMFAGFYSKPELIDALIKAGSDVNAVDDEGYTPLMAAALGNNLEAVNILINAGADVNAKTKNGTTPLMAALSYAPTFSISEMSILHFALDISEHDKIVGEEKLKEINIDIVKKLIKAGATLDAIITPDGFTPLMLAAMSSNIEVVSELLNAGAKAGVNNKTKDGFTPLMFAAGLDFSGVGPMISFAKSFAQAFSGKEVELEKSLYDDIEMISLNTKEKSNPQLFNLLIQNGADINVQTNNGYTPLMIASLNGNIDIVKTLIDNKVDVNAKSSDQQTALVLAKNDNVVEALINAGADINVNNTKGLTPMITANSSTMVKTLVKAGANVNEEDEKGLNNLIYHVISTDKTDIEQINALISLGADIKKTINITWSELQKIMIDVPNAFYSGEDKLTFNLLMLESLKKNPNIELIKFLLNSGIDVNYKNEYSMSPLILASLQGNFELIDALINAGADVNVKTTEDNKYGGKNGMSALMFAIKNGAEIKTVNRIIQAGADVNATSDDHHHLTPLDYALYKGKPNKELIDILIKAGANVDEWSFGNNVTPFTLGSDDNTNIVKDLVTSGIDINKTIKIKWNYLKRMINMSENFTTGENFNLLMIECLKPNPNLETVKFLISSGIDVNYKNDANFTALIAASKHHNFELIDILLNAGADVNVQTKENFRGKIKNGVSPLMNAVSNNASVEIVNRLIESGAAVNLKNDGRGITAIFYAFYSYNPNKEIIDTLIKAGADINIKTHPTSSETILMLALGSEVESRYIDPEIVSILIAAGVDVNAEGGWHKSTALLRAAHYKDIMEILIKAGADITHQDKDGKNVLMYSIVCPKNTEAIEFLINLGVDINLRNNEGKTVLSIAKNNKGHCGNDPLGTINTKIIELLEKVGAKE